VGLLAAGVAREWTGHRGGGGAGESESKTDS
jgi:hypothetical protein